MATNTQAQQQVKESSVIVEQELKRINANQLYAAVKNSAEVLIALGITEMIFGATAMILPAFSPTIFATLLGGAVLISGILNIISSVSQNSGGRLFLGIIAALAGVLMISFPIFGFDLMAALAGLYLGITGIARFFEPKRTSWALASGALALIFGIILLASPAESMVLVGILVGFNLLFGGIITARTGAFMKSALR